MSQNSSRTAKWDACGSLWKTGTTPVHCQVALARLRFLGHTLSAAEVLGPRRNHGPVTQAIEAALPVG